MIQYKRIDTSSLSQTGRTLDSTFSAIKAVNIRNIDDNISLGVSSDLDPTNHSMLLDRITRKGNDVIDIVSEHLPPASIKEFPWERQKNPTFRPDADALSARFHREIFLYEVRAFMLAHELPMNNIRVFNLHLGKERRHLVIIDTDFPDSEMSEVYNWRDRIQKRHGVHIRFDRESDTLSPVERFLKTAQHRGIIGPEQTIDNLIPGSVNPAQEYKNKYPLEDHRRIPLLSIDDSKIQNREDAHLGVKLDQGYYIDTHVPLYELPNEGFKKGRDVVTIAIGYEITPSGEIGELHVRQALARNYLPLRFGDVNSLERSIELQPPFSGSVRTLFEAAMAHRQGLGFQNKGKPLNSPMNSAEMISELMVASERVFAAECNRLKIPIIARKTDDSDHRVLNAVEKLIESDRTMPGSWLSLTLGNAILKFKDTNSQEMIDFILQERLGNHSFFVQTYDSYHPHNRARAKARGLEGQVNQRQWLSTTRGQELAYSPDELQSACNILNERYINRYHKLVSVIESIPNGLFEQVGKYFDGTIMQTDRECLVLTPEINVLGRMNHMESLGATAELFPGDIRRSRVKFLGFDMNQGDLIFEPAKTFEQVA
jgi:hypothetical protein